MPSVRGSRRRSRRGSRGRASSSAFRRNLGFVVLRGFRLGFRLCLCLGFRKGFGAAPFQKRKEGGVGLLEPFQERLQAKVAALVKDDVFQRVLGVVGRVLDDPA